MAFAFHALKLHVTYKTHLDLDKFKNNIFAKTLENLWSFVHENGDTDHTLTFLFGQRKLCILKILVILLLSIHTRIYKHNVQLFGQKLHV